MRNEENIVAQMIDVFYKVNSFVENHEAGISIGITSPDKLPDASKRFFDHWTQLIEELLEGCQPFSNTYSSWMDQRFITYKEFIDSVRKDDHHLDDDVFLHNRFYEFFLISNYGEKRELLIGIQDNFQGYIKLLGKSRNPVIKIFLEHQLEMKLPRDAMNRNIHILGMTGQGKSNLLKLMLHGLILEDRKQSIVLVDPHGDLASEVRDFAIHIKDPQRLVYIDPFFDDKRLLVFNPFDISNKKSEAFIDTYSQELTKTLVELLKDGTTLTGQMEAVLRPAISTLLTMEGSTLQDLQKLMDISSYISCQEIISKGLTNSFPMHRSMFEKIWGRDQIPNNYKTTLNSIYTKIQTLFNTHAFYELTCGNQGKSTIDLESYVNDGKIIICNLSKGHLGTEASEAFGKFIVSNLQTLAFRRASQIENRIPTYIFIDEFQNFVTDSISTILSEARKYAMHMILSHQSIGQISDAKVRDTVLGNTAIKIIGRASNKTLRIMSDEISIDLTELNDLQPYEFYISSQSLKKVRNSTPYKVKPSSHLVDRNPKYYQNIEEQVAIKNYVLSKYYVKRGIVAYPKHTDQESKGKKKEVEQSTKPKFDI